MEEFDYKLFHRAILVVMMSKGYEEEVIKTFNEEFSISSSKATTHIGGYPRIRIFCQYEQKIANNPLTTKTHEAAKDAINILAGYCHIYPAPFSKDCDLNYFQLPPSAAKKFFQYARTYLEKYTRNPDNPEQEPELLGYWERFVS